MWPCLCFCTPSWKDEFAAVIYIYEFMPFGPVWNDGSFSCNKTRWCWIYNHPHQLPPFSPSPPSSSVSPHSACLNLLNMDGTEEKREGRRCRGGTFLSPRLPLSPVSHLRRCGTGINGIQEHGEMAAGTMYLCVCKLHGCSRWNSEYSPPRVSICENTHADTQKWWSVNEWGWSA